MSRPFIERLVRRNWHWKRFFAEVAILCAILGVMSLDESAPDVSDLKPTRRQLPDDQNAFLVLEKAFGLVQHKFDDSYDNDRLILKSMAVGSTWDFAEARKWLGPLTEVWTLLAKAAALPSGQVPANFEIVPAVDVTHPFDPGFPLQILFNFAILHGWQLCHEQGTAAGIDWILANLHTARMLEESRGGFVGLGVGADFRLDLEATLVAMAARPDAPAASLRRALGGLAELRPDIREFEENLRVNFDGLPANLDAMHQGKIKLEHTDTSPRMDAAFHYAIQFPLFFKPHQILRLMAESYRGALKLGDADWAQDVAWRKADEARLSAARWGHWNPDNFFSVLYLDAQPMGMAFALRQRLKVQSSISAAEADLALCLYYREHGELPDKLDQLVPGYLPVVPTDYFDGQPIRYSRDYFAVWSVGTGNSTVTKLNPEVRPKFLLEMDDPDFAPEIYYRLDFAAPPRPVTPGQSSVAPPGP